MIELNKELKGYIDKEILPIYDKNEMGHGLAHIYYVIRRCLEFAKKFPEVNLDMLYTMASYHDVAHHIDKNNHEILSADRSTSIDDFMERW